MNYVKTKGKLQKLKVFSLNDLFLLDADFRQGTLYDWENQGKVRKIRNKWYVFNDMNPENYDYYLIANRIYSPSYISLELALNHNGVIPEAVMQITSVTSRRTKTFETDFGNYSYKSFKKSLFFGYEVIEYDEIGVKVASLEKAVLDYLYLNPKSYSIEDFNSLRFNKNVLLENLNEEKLYEYLKIFSNKRLNKTIEILFKYINS